MKQESLGFQKTDYNLDWAIKNKYNKTVFCIIKNLYINHKNDFENNIEKVSDYLSFNSFEHFVQLTNELNLTFTNIHSSEDILFL